MPAAAHGAVPAAAPDTLAAGLGCLSAAGCVVASFAGTVEVTAGAGLAHTLPWAAPAGCSAPPPTGAPQPLPGATARGRQEAAMRTRQARQSRRTGAGT